MKWIALLLLLSGCASYKQVYVVPVPLQSNTYVKSYDTYPTFKGFELIVGLPGLKSVPIIGPLFGELIQIRAGINQDVVVPVMEPIKAPGVMGAAPELPKRVDREKSRWSSYSK